MPINGDIFLKKMDTFIEKTDLSIQSTNQVLKRLEDLIDYELEKGYKNKKEKEERVYVKTKNPLNDISEKFDKSNILLTDILEAIKDKGSNFTSGLGNNFNIKDLLPLLLASLPTLPLLYNIIKNRKQWFENIDDTMDLFEDPGKRRTKTVLKKAFQEVTEEQASRINFTKEEKKFLDETNKQLAEITEKKYGKGDTIGSRFKNLFEYDPNFDSSKFLGKSLGKAADWIFNNPSFSKKLQDQGLLTQEEIDKYETSSIKKDIKLIDKENELRKIRDLVIKTATKRSKKEGTYSESSLPIMKRIMKEEGIDGYDETAEKYFPYKDQKGYSTIGRGHLIKEDEDFSKGLTKEEINKLFLKDFESHKKLASQFPNYDKLTKKQQESIIDLTFNMGSGWFKEKSEKYWPSLVKSIQDKNYEGIESAILNSELYSINPQRAKRNIIGLSNGRLSPGDATPNVQYNNDTPDSLIANTMKDLKNIFNGTGSGSGVVLSEKSIERLAQKIGQNIIKTQKQDVSVFNVDARK